MVKVKSADDGILTVVMGGKVKKKTAAKTDALYSALFIKTMAIKSQKKVYRSPSTARKHWLNCHIKTATNEKT